MVQKKRNRITRLALTVMAGCSAWVATDSAMGQNFVRDYFVNEQRFYSPQDYYERGWIYRVQAGYAGLFNRCDDDAAKRYSPYIYWKERPSPACRGRIYPNLSDAALEIEQGVQRFTDGAGNCARPNDGQHGPPRFLPTLANGLVGGNCQTGYPHGPTLGTPVFESTVPNDAPVHQALPIENEWIEPEMTPEAKSLDNKQTRRTRPQRPIAGAPIGGSALDLNEPRRLPLGETASAGTKQARNAGVHSVDHLRAASGQATDISRTASSSSSTSSRRR